MAQRHTPRTQTGRTVLGFQKVEVPKPRRRKAGNDNAKTSLSGLTFREQRVRKQRAADFAWQVKFAEMKLRLWRNPDNPNWDPLAALLKAAEDKQTRLGPV